jgi:hypothetical protein
MSNTRKKKSNNDHGPQITVAIIGTLGVIVAALISTMPMLLSRINPTATPLPLPTQTTSPSPTPTIVLSPTPADPLLAAKQWPIALLDDFSNSGRQNWPAIDDAGEAVIESFDLTFQLDVVTGGDVQYALYKRSGVILGENFLLSMESSSKEQTGCYYGLLFKVTDQGDYYWFQIRHGNMYKLSQVLNGNATDLIPEKSLPSGMEVSSLSVLGKGTYYQLYINDKLIDVFLDGTINNGLAGIGTVTCQYLDQAQFAFDNFEIRTSDPIPTTNATSVSDTNPRLIFSETFDNNIAGWNIESIQEADHSTFREIKDGKYYRTLETTANSSGYWSTSSIPDVLQKDFCLIFDAQINEHSGNGALVIVARANNYDDSIDDSYYYIGLNLDGTGTVYLDRAGENNSRKIATFDKSFAWESQKSNKVKISFRDGNLALYDGNTNTLLQTMNFTDDDLLLDNGQIRLGTELFEPNQKVIIEFDNVFVYDKCP